MEYLAFFHGGRDHWSLLEWCARAGDLTLYRGTRVTIGSYKLLYILIKYRMLLISIKRKYFKYIVQIQKLIQNKHILRLCWVCEYANGMTFLFKRVMNIISVSRTRLSLCAWHRLLMFCFYFYYTVECFLEPVRHYNIPIGLKYLKKFAF